MRWWGWLWDRVRPWQPTPLMFVTVTRRNVDRVIGPWTDQDMAEMVDVDRWGQ